VFGSGCLHERDRAVREHRVPFNDRRRAIPFDSGIEGTLTRNGVSDDGGALVDGQILIWGPRPEEPAETTTTGVTLPGRPSEAVLVDDGVFTVDLRSGWYQVRGTAIVGESGEICDEFWVEVTPHEITEVDFVCR